MHTSAPNSTAMTPRPTFGSMRFVYILQRNFLVWRKLMWGSVLGNIAEPLITIMALGYGLGTLVGQVQNIPYVLFLVSGSVCMSVMNAATFEGTYSAYSRMVPQKTWDGILNAPMELEDIVLGELVWAGIKSLLTASAILLVVLVLGISREPTLVFLLPACLLIGCTFAALALIFNALAKGYDFFSYYFTLVLTPMTFLSGIYFPLAQLPAWLKTVAQVLPLYHAVALVRPLFLGQWPQADALLHCGVLLLYALGAYYLALRLTRRRFFA